ncbi:MAG: DUF1365 domain-containing protein [Candidatus Omnitrophota bacterium]
MGLNSCLYELNVWHDRRSPKRYTFEHKIFMFYLDLDELSEISRLNWLIGHNQSRAYNFKDEDHILSGGKTAKESVLSFVKSKGLSQPVAKVKLLTNLRTFGYIFNPVSFYFCFDSNNNPLCVVAQIGNTFGELKYFYLGPQKCIEKTFDDQQVKYYYISPFTDLDNSLEFKIQVPDEKLNILIDVTKNGEKFFFSSMVGRVQELSSWNLFLNTLKYPLVTFKIIFYIHWHAAILHFFKKIPHHLKEERPQDQKEVYRPCKR